MKNGTRNGLSGFTKQQHHKVQWFYKQFVKWDIFRYDAIHQDNIYMDNELTLQTDTYESCPVKACYSVQWSKSSGVFDLWRTIWS